MEHALREEAAKVEGHGHRVLRPNRRPVRLRERFDLARLKGGGVEFAPIVLPPSRITWWEVGPAAISPDDAFDQLAKGVGVAGVPIDVDDHVEPAPE